MFRCLQLARQGGGYVAPNPMVGAVIVHQGRIIGEGYHHRYGEAHAEPNAIHSVKDPSLLKESTLYVNLEPCSHYGKTPPCANLIVEKQIPRVVIGTTDPNPKVSGRGIQIMKAAGIDVQCGVIEEACIALNKRFFYWQTSHRPYVLLKWAQTKDGFMDVIRTSREETPLLISTPLTRQITHKIRSENQAIMVSTNTAILDNPKLSLRHWAGKSPVRVVLDREGRIPVDSHLFDQQVRTLVFTAHPRPNKDKLEYIAHDFGYESLKGILSKLAKMNIHSVLVEGGAALHMSFMAEGLWDEAMVEVSDTVLGQGVKAPVPASVCDHSERVDNHLFLYYINQHKQFG